MIKALLLDTNRASFPIYKALVNLKYEVTVLGNKPHEPLAKASEIYKDIDYSNTNLLLKFLKENQFDYIVPGCTDISYKSYAFLKNKDKKTLEFDNYLQIFNKEKFKQNAEELGISVPQKIDLSNYKSFVGYYPIPTRYGMTVGELSFMVKSKKWLDCENLDLIIVKMDNWNRKMYFDDTKLKWIQPSPNIPDLKTAIVYPGMCIFEATNVSEGRGTNIPFSLIGAPWIDEMFSKKLNNLKISGTEITFKSFKPISIEGKSENPKHLDALCNGIILNITNRDSFQPIKTALKAIMLAKEIYPLEK